MLNALCSLPLFKRKAFIKTLLIMKLTAIFMLAFALQIGAKGYSQSVTLSLKDAPLEKVFTALEKQTGYYFTYTRELLQGTKPVDLEVRNASLKEVLAICFKEQPVTYEIIDKVIIIKQGVQKKINSGFLPPPPITVKGKVVNEKGDGVIATVLVKGTNNGVTTNSDGTFELKNVDENATLVISGVNIENAVEIKVNGKTDMGSIATVTKVAEGETIVLNAGPYKTDDKRRTGNIIRISGKEIEKQPVTSLLMSLQGRVPGLEITPTNGTPGSAPTIRIRGQNSLRPEAGIPLYIIDGLPIDSRPLQSINVSLMTLGADPLAGIDPANIESIEVLKDADATAIYGSRGANGVILITTKKGVRSGTINIDLKAYRGIGRMANRMELLDRDQYLAMRREAYNNNGLLPSGVNALDLVEWDITRDTDWQDELLGGTVDITDVQAGLSGGNANTSFRFALGHHKETMITPGDFAFKRTSGNLSVNHNSSNQKFRVGLSVNYGATKSNLFDESNFVPLALTLSPVAPRLYKDNGELNWEVRSNGTEGWTNPLSLIMRDNQSKSGEWRAASNLSYAIAKGITLRTTLAYTDFSEDQNTKIPISARAPSTITPTTTGNSTFGINKRKSWIIEPQAEYSKKFGNSQLDLLVGSTWQKSDYLFQQISASGYSSDAFLGSLLAAKTILYVFDDTREYKYASVFSRLGYNYKEKYLVNLTARRDGSSRFGPGKQFGNFGAVGLGWIFSNESFVAKALPFLSFGKLRGSYGTTGNDQVPDYQYYSTYSIYTSGYQTGTSIYPSALHNPNFKWEVTTKLEVAIQLGFLNDRISAEAAYFRNRSSNQLVSYRLPETTGFPSILSNFNATIENSGWEFLLRSTNINHKNFKWSTSANISINRNKLVAFPGIEQSADYALKYKVGEPLSIQRLYTWTGVNPQTGFHEFEDINRDGVLDDADKTFMNPRDRKYYGGVTNNITYKRFELSFLFQFSRKDATRYLTTSPAGATISNNQPSWVLNRWRNPGDVTDVQRFNLGLAGASFTSNTNLLQSNYAIEDASFLRLKTLSLSYSLPQTLLSKAKLKDAKIYFQGQNLFTITNYSGLDAETGSFTLPPLFMITTGIQFTF